jgi:hypothetical protein
VRNVEALMNRAHCRVVGEEDGFGGRDQHALTEVTLHESRVALVEELAERRYNATVKPTKYLRPIWS